MADIGCIAVDWGTTSFRMYALSNDGAVLGERRSDEGLLVAARSGFETVLESHAAALGAGRQVPAILCGMVGSRTGWVEADYLNAPLALSDVASRATRVPGTARDVRILPGVAQRAADAPDVMRGEETKLLGLQRHDGLVVMPGTHTKWAALAGGRLEGFSTFMTGEIFAHLTRSDTSVLRQAIAGQDGVDTSCESFAQGVRDSLDSPMLLANRLFGVRAGWLLEGRSPRDNVARLSGLLIGAEIAGAQRLYGAIDGLCLVGSGPGAEAYRRALDAAEVTRVTLMDADRCARAGLHRANALSTGVGEKA